MKELVDSIEFTRAHAALQGLGENSMAGPDAGHVAHSSVADGL